MCTTWFNQKNREELNALEHIICVSLVNIVFFRDIFTDHESPEARKSFG